MVTRAVLDIEQDLLFALAEVRVFSLVVEIEASMIGFSYV